MKHFAFTFLLAVCAIALEAQTSHYVSLYPTPGPNRYTTVQAAVDASSAGDTVYVEGGFYSGSINIDHDLTVVGPGFFPKNNDSLANVSLLPARWFQTTNTRGGASISLVGLSLGSMITYDSSSLIITSCKIGSISLRNTKSVFIYGSVIGGVSKAGADNTNYLGVFNCLFTSLGVGLRTFTSPGASLSSDVSNCDVVNSVFLGGLEVSTGQVFNSILSSSNFASSFVSVSNCVFIGIQQGSSTIPNSIWNATESDLFTMDGVEGKYYQLKPISPAIGAGSGGTDCGIFGGSAPFVLGGVQNVPWIHQFNINAAGSQGSGVDVNVKVRAQ